LQQYLAESVHVELETKNSYQTVFTIASSVSKFLIPLYQYHFPDPPQICLLLNVSNILNVIAVLVWYLASDAGNIDACLVDDGVGMNYSISANRSVFYVFLTFNGLVTGGTMSLIYDLVNVYTNANMTSTMILTSGIYIGSSLYPWLVSVVWEAQSASTRHMVYPTGTLIASIIILCSCPSMQFLSYKRDAITGAITGKGKETAAIEEEERLMRKSAVGDIQLVFRDDGIVLAEDQDNTV